MDTHSTDFYVSSHHYIYGQTEALVNYLRVMGVKRLLTLLHDLPNVDTSWPGKNLTLVEQYRAGKLVSRKVVKTGGNEMLHYLRQFAVSLRAGLVEYSVNRKSFDVFIGVDSFNALIGLILRRMRIVRKVIFYSHSYLPRYPGGFLKNAAYQFLEKVCSKKCDMIWNLSTTSTDYRRKKYKLSSERCITVETGLEMKGSLSSEMSRENHEIRLAFVGHLSERSGLFLVIDALKDIIDRFPEIVLIIIGGGPLNDALARQVKSTGLEERVVFLGPRSYFDVLKIVRGSDIGLAMYPHSVHSDVKTTDPMKIKIYLALGLPVITTKMTPMSTEIAEWSAGIVIGFDRNQFREAVVRILSELEFFKGNASRLAEKYGFWDSDQIFDEALNRSLTFLL